VRVNPVDPPGALRRLGRRKLELGSLEESRRRGSILVGPPKPAACDEVPQAPAMEYSSWPNDGRKRWGLVQAGERKTRPPRCKRGAGVACTSPATQPDNQGQVVARTGCG
jgi:hypothetical protein